MQKSSFKIYFMIMLSRRVLQSLNALPKKSRNHFNGSRRLLSKQWNTKNYSTFHSNCFTNNNTVSLNVNKLCSVCFNIVPSRCLKTDIIRPDNVVVSPYTEADIPDCMLHELIWQYMDRFPDYTAIECSLTGRKYTFAQLRNRCKKFAAALLKSGFKPGQVVAVILPNLPEFPIALFGAFEAGLVVSTVNPSYTGDEIYHQLKDSNSVCVITFADKLSVVQQTKAKLEEESKGALKLKIISIQDYDGISRPYPEGVWSFREMVENNLDTAAVNSISVEYDIKPEDVVVLPYSSGTTGLPKGVCLTHCNLVSNIRQMEQEECAHIVFPDENFQDIMPAILPFFHIYGLNVILMQALRHGAKLVTLTKFEPESFLKLLKEHKSTIICAVPPMILFCGSHHKIKKEYFQNLRILGCGAAPIGKSDLERVMRIFPEDMIFVQAYGLTETSPLALIPANKKSNNYSTVGKPASLTKAKIIDENNKCLGVGETGELCIHGPQVMKGYLNKPEATAETIDKDGWLHTGDIGYYDKDGNFYIVDRMKELIKVKGFQVAPAELEALIRNHPRVADVAVVGIPDPRSGEIPIAYVVPKQGQDQLSAENIKSYIADKVVEYKQLSDVIFTDAIPKSASGKILRRVLKQSHLNANK